jgi:hypothetical protein
VSPVSDHERGFDDEDFREIAAAPGVPMPTLPRSPSIGRLESPDEVFDADVPEAMVGRQSTQAPVAPCSASHRHRASASFSANLRSSGQPFQRSDLPW